MIAFQHFHKSKAILTVHRMDFFFFLDTSIAEKIDNKMGIIKQFLRNFLR